MIIFEFRIDEVELAEDLEFDLKNLDLDLFVLTVFIFPVRLNINGVEFFRYNRPDPQKYWDSMPIINLASNGLIYVKSIPEQGNVEYDIPEGGGVLNFTMLPQNQVSVTFGKSIHVIVPYQELLTAFENFAANVRAFLNEKVPQMHQHPYWGPWLRGERD